MFCLCKTGVWCVLISVSKSPWHIFTACHSRGHPLSSVILVWFLVSHCQICSTPFPKVSNSWNLSIVIIAWVCASFTSEKKLPEKAYWSPVTWNITSGMWKNNSRQICVWACVEGADLQKKCKKQKPCLIASQVLEHLQAKYPEKMNENHKSWNWMQGHRHTGCLLKMNLCFKSK